LIKRNFELNNLKNADIFIEISKKDASLLFSELSQLKHNEKPNVISIDPFGTPNLYIDPAFKAIINKGGLMCITATDTPVLFGVKIDACLRKYMAKPLNNEFHKETGARILMYFIQRIANINKVGILPLLTMYSNHFVRIFGLTFKSKKDISESIKNFGYFIYCKHCGYRSWCENMILNIPECCPSCEKREKLEFAGPLWLGELHKRDYLERLIELNVKSSYKNRNRLNTILSIALEEILL
jgi:tRNA (guanine26-N2/guanine27-N2)-dimethyltransferase